MSKILGQDGTAFGSPTTGTDQSFSAGAMAFAAGYVPLFNGNVTSFNVYCASGGSAGNIQVCLYQGASPSTGGATLLGTSNTVASPNNNSLLNLPCTPIAVNTGNTYSLFVSCFSGSLNTQFNTGSSAFALSQYNSTHFPSGAPPGTTFNPRDANTGHEFVIWADSAASIVDAGDVQLMPMNQRTPQLAGPYQTLQFSNGIFQQFGPPQVYVPPSGSSGSAVYRRRKHHLVQGH